MTVLRFLYVCTQLQSRNWQCHVAALYVCVCVLARCALWLTSLAVGCRVCNMHDAFSLNRMSIFSIPFRFVPIEVFECDLVKSLISNLIFFSNESNTSNTHFISFFPSFSSDIIIWCINSNFNWAYHNNLKPIKLLRKRKVLIKDGEQDLVKFP